VNYPYFLQRTIKISFLSKLATISCSVLSTFRPLISTSLSPTNIPAASARPSGTTLEMNTDPSPSIYGGDPPPPAIERPNDPSPERHSVIVCYYCISNGIILELILPVAIEINLSSGWRQVNYFQHLDQ